MLCAAGGLGLPVNSAWQQGKWRSTVDVNARPFEQFDPSDLSRSALGQGDWSRLSMQLHD